MHFLASNVFIRREPTEFVSQHELCRHDAKIPKKYINFRYLKVSSAEKRIKVVISYKTELPFPQIFAGNARP